MLTEEQAMEVAWRLAESAATHLRFPLRSEPTRVSLDDHSGGHEALGISTSFWAFIFRMEVPEGSMIHPDFVHIVVDPLTGNAAFLPLL
ncbi:hypothetical protein [Luteolibacter flavescens]|uniref:hypothetical protein n=1 Tax=Luteolibacter flavescens TaxID=1859460 RepID=UPI0022235AD4|nr:hypothetical protein [Luteolibacter flavescens]